MSSSRASRHVEVASVCPRRTTQHDDLAALRLLPFAIVVRVGHGFGSRAGRAPTLLRGYCVPYDMERRLRTWRCVTWLSLAEKHQVTRAPFSSVALSSLYSFVLFAIHLFIFPHPKMSVCLALLQNPLRTSIEDENCMRSGDLWISDLFYPVKRRQRAPSAPTLRAPTAGKTDHQS